MYGIGFVLLGVSLVLLMLAAAWALDVFLRAVWDLLRRRR